MADRKIGKLREEDEGEEDAEFPWEPRPDTVQRQASR